MNNKSTNQNLIHALYFNRKTILFIVVLFTLSAILITFFIPKKYTATGIVYPTKSNTMKEVVNNPAFGYEMQADRLIQLFESQQMKEKVVKKFDLVNLFEIDTLNSDWRNSLKKNYEKSILLSRTKFLSVEITAVMSNPQLAANVVNFMISYVDTIRRDVFMENTKIWVNDLRVKIKIQEMIVDELLSKIFLYSNSNETNTLAKNREAHISARKENATILQGDPIVLERLEGSYSIGLEKLINTYYLELGVLNGIQSDLTIGEQKLSAPFPKVYIIENAIVDKKKTSPSGLKNGIIGLIAGLVLSISFFIGKLKWNAIAESLKD